MGHDKFNPPFSTKFRKQKQLVKAKPPALDHLKLRLAARGRKRVPISLPKTEVK